MDTDAFEVIQGDTINRYFTLVDDEDKPIPAAQISAVYFSCRGVGCQKKLSYSEAQESYTLFIATSETQQMEAGKWTYDITVQYADSKRRTATYNGAFTVLPKNNPVKYGADGK